VNFVVRPWVKSADYWGVKFELTEAIKKRFDEVGISFPYPQQDVYLHNVSADQG
jgi:small conductance mechanosensitive channel